LKNFILSKSIFYRTYQKIVRGQNSEYNFYEFVFNKLYNKVGKLNVLDICCGDSFILDYVKQYLNTYTGLDYNENYLKNCKIKWPNFNFLKLDLKSFNNFKSLNLNKINVVFLHGVIHHFDDKLLTRIIRNLTNSYPKSYYIFADPVIDNNKLINRVMIYYDRGKFIRKKLEYKIIMKEFESFIVDDFYKMSFKYIFHYKNFNLKKYYNQWKI